MFNPFFLACLFGLHKWRWQIGSVYDDCDRCGTTRMHVVGTQGIRPSKR